MSYIKQTLSLPYSAQQNGVSSTILTKSFDFQGELAKIASNFITTLNEAARKSFNGRLERGLELAKAGCVEIIQTPGSSRCFRVHSIDGGNQYEVNLELRKCSCPDSQQGHTCKHRVAAYYFEQANSKLAKVIEFTEKTTVGQSPTLTNQVKQPVPEPKSVGLSQTDQILSELGFPPEGNSPKQPAQKLGFLNRHFLHGQDLTGLEYNVKIAAVTKEMVTPHPSQEPVEKWCLWVEGLPPEFATGILFGTRGEEDLVAIFGNVDVNDLVGNSVVIYPKAMNVAGQPKTSIRFRRAI